ncbi:protease [Gigaspora margarita]|uniref:Protease n=1 Tax=Gigaspora margarita TaxID=4874 RepID=A0A8H4EJZ5_GIGMA|nr:protease [Gigaspora margarita]
MNADRTLIQHLDELYFANTYLNIQNNTLTVYTVDMSKVPEILSIPEVKRYESFLDFRKVNNSLSYLKSSFNEITKLAKQNNPEGIFVSINSKFNNIIIIVETIRRNSSQEEVLGEYIRTVSQYNPEVIFLNSSRSLNSLTSLHNKRGSNPSRITETLFCGQVIHNDFDDTVCSAGFFAKNSSHTFLVTTGHCNYDFKVSKSKKKFSTLYTTRPRLIGKIGIFFGISYDIALIDIKRMSKHIRPSSGVFFENSPNNLELFINNNGTPVSTHGAHLCKAGFRTSVTCGYTESFNGFYMFTDSHFLEDLIFVSNMETLHGDSGGPSFAFTDTNIVTINGILSGTIKRKTPVSPFSYTV